MGSNLVKTAELIIGILGAVVGLIATMATEGIAIGFCIWIGTALTVFSYHLVYCHLKNQEETNRLLQLLVGDEDEEDEDEYEYVLDDED